MSAAPRVPVDPAEVLERLPTRSTDPALRQARQALARQPGDPVAAVALVERLLQDFAADGDPRLLGQAQAALAPWWTQARPPREIRLQRAVLRQYGHAFDAARADLEAVVAERADEGRAWAWLAAIAMVQARYDDARSACAQLAAQAPPAIAVGCRAAADALSGQADAAAAALRQALQQDRRADAAQRLWALTRLAEIERQRGDDTAAEQRLREALALQRPDTYLLAAFADLLLDQGRAPEVLTLLAGQERNDLLLLRLALAARAARHPQATAWAQMLQQRFDEARLRGDATHDKEASRHALALRQDPRQALALARANWAVQREPADARVLLEAALAQGDAAAAAPVLQWLAGHPRRHALLDPLAARLRALPAAAVAATPAPSPAASR